MVKRDSKAPHLDVVYIDFFARRAESARMSARSSSIVVDPGVREHYVGVEVFLPETAWVDGAAGVRQAFADLFRVMDLGGRRTRWDLDSSWILELLDLPEGSDTWSNRVTSPPCAGCASFASAPSRSQRNFVHPLPTKVLTGKVPRPVPA